MPEFTTEQINAWLANPPQLGDPGYEDYSMWKFFQEWEKCARPEEHIQLANNDWILAGDLKVGDEVASSEGVQKVTRVERVEDSSRCEVFFEEGDSIVSSYSHPYFVKDKGFVKVIDLEKGDVIGELVVDSKKSFPDGPVISLSVDKAETYILRGGTEENPVPVLSHNKSPAPDEQDKPPKIGDPKGPPPEASAETWLNPDGTLKEEYLAPILEQISGSPYFQALAGEQPDLSGFAQTSDLDKAIAGALAGYNLEGPDLSGYAQTGDVQSAISDALGGLGLDNYMSLQDWEQRAEQFVGQDMIQNMINDAVSRGLTSEQIQQMILDATGGTITPEQVQQMIDTATETMPGVEQIQQMIDQALKDGLSPQEIQDMIAEYLAANPVEGMTPEVVQQMIAESQATLESLGGLTEAEIQALIEQGLKDGLTPEQIQQMVSEATGGAIDATTVQQMIDAAIQGMTAGDEGLTEDAVQQMIDAAMAGGMTMDQIQQMLGDSGYMTQEQIQQMMGESGYLGQQGVDASVQAALDAALGEGGSISSAIAAAMQAAGGGGGGETGGGETTPTEPVPAPNYTIPTSYTPYTDYSNPYGSVSPYDIMGTEQFGGTTPFSGGTTTGAATGSGISGLPLGDPLTYNYALPVEEQAGLYPTGTNISWDDFLNYGRAVSPEDKASWEAWKQSTNT
jgi:DNA-binding transcriptional regulator YhcF (GntR family)